MDHAKPDFPFYNGQPALISGRQWLFVMAMVAAGLAALMAPIPAFQGGIGQFVPAVLFVAVPLAGLALVSPRHWTALFKPVGARDVGWMIAFGIINVVVTMAAGLVALKTLGLTANPAVAAVGQLSTTEAMLFFLKTLPQLVGEEILTILPFLALMYFLVAYLRVGRGLSIVIAWLATAVLFGLMHLPTYNWNLAQVLLIIGLARLILSLAYIKTKNLWVSAGAHIFNDWTFFIVSLLGAHQQ